MSTPPLAPCIKAHITHLFLTCSLHTPHVIVSHPEADPVPQHPKISTSPHFPTYPMLMLHSCLLLDRLDHVIPLPRCLEVQHELLVVLTLGVLHNCAAAIQVLGHTLGVLHNRATPVQVIHVRTGHVKLPESELRVMCQINAFILEDTSNLVHAVHLGLVLL
ncbi:hypothetical protein DFJ58DRAFT_734519 [Suillus subalutaceus]|uniref:uncharacterized protein n=1 Tax=Suillus subalutaceus TaxID=48586 RepID=UPI001B86C635|nr:uncharacterized protein DFJ58DRAFT_734519 [Suillus subalutaceus]KAG1837166.1 hypothetical protein DFJ58DRAFT_734519 [Suillus subalutaceus]